MSHPQNPASCTDNEAPQSSAGDFYEAIIVFGVLIALSIAGNILNSLPLAVGGPIIAGVGYIAFGLFTNRGRK